MSAVACPCADKCFRDYAVASSVSESSQTQMEKNHIPGGFYGSLTGEGHPELRSSETDGRPCTRRLRTVGRTVHPPLQPYRWSRTPVGTRDYERDAGSVEDAGHGFGDPIDSSHRLWFDGVLPPPCRFRERRLSLDQRRSVHPDGLVHPRTRRQSSPRRPGAPGIVSPSGPRLDVFPGG